MQISFRFNCAASLMLGVLLMLVCVLGVLPARAQPQPQTVFEKTTLVLKKMRNEKISAQKAFDDGLLTKDVLLFALGENDLLDTPQSDSWEGPLEALAWTQLLIEKFPEAVANSDGLPIIVQTNIGRWYLSKKGKRGVKIMENVLKNLSRENPDMATISTTISWLANYYGEIGETEKSIATQLKAQEFTQQPEFVSGFFFTAANTAHIAGYTKRAQQLYEQAIDIGDDWTKGQSILALSRILFNEDKVDEARALLQKQVEGEHADEIRFQLNKELMESYYDRGEWDKANKWAKITIEHYDALKTPDKAQQWQWLVENARRMPQQIEQWQKNPLETSATQIEMQAPTTAAERVAFEKKKSFAVYSYRTITPSAVSDNPQLKVVARPMREKWRIVSTDRNIFFDFAPEALKNGLKAEISITCPEFPGITLRVPVTLQKAAP